jgi:hypothetical protein
MPRPRAMLNSTRARNWTRVILWNWAGNTMNLSKLRLIVIGGSVEQTTATWRKSAGRITVRSRTPNEEPTTPALPSFARHQLQSAPQLILFSLDGRRKFLRGGYECRIYRLVRPELRFVRSIEMPRDSLRMNLRVPIVREPFAWPSCDGGSAWHT